MNLYSIIPEAIDLKDNWRPWEVLFHRMGTQPKPKTGAMTMVAMIAEGLKADPYRIPVVMLSVAGKGCPVPIDNYLDSCGLDRQQVVADQVRWICKEDAHYLDQVTPASLAGCTPFTFFLQPELERWFDVIRVWPKTWARVRELYFASIINCQWHRGLVPYRELRGRWLSEAQGQEAVLHAIGEELL